MRPFRITRRATLWFPPTKMRVGPTHAGWPFISFEVVDGWVRARLFRTTIRLASSRRVKINPRLAREIGAVPHNLVMLDASEVHSRQGESWSWHWPVRPETLRSIWLRVEDDDCFGDLLDALRHAGFTLTDETDQ
jgi:hypothetical protein